MLKQDKKEAFMQKPVVWCSEEGPYRFEIPSLLLFFDKDIQNQISWTGVTWLFLFICQYFENTKCY